MTASEQGPPRTRRVPSGIEGLDQVLDGGFMLGGMYILQGPPGAGKTILTNQVCFNHVRAGGSAIFVTLLAENHARMLNNMRLFSFFDESAIPDRLVYLSAFVEMRDGGLEALLPLLRREIQRRGTTLLVIDGLVSAHDSSASDREFKQFIHDLQEIALATDCTMFFTTNDTREVSPERTMVDGLIVLSDRAHGWQAASDLQVTKFRGSGFMRGRHSYLIAQDGIVVYPRIEALYATPSIAETGREGRTSSGIDPLDVVLGGGLPIDSTTILVGPSGIGKTTFGLQFLARSTAQEPGLLFGFYETPVRLRTRARHVDPSIETLCDSGAIEFLWQTPTSELLDASGQRLLEAVRRRGVRRLFIDGLTAFQNGVIDPARLGNFFTALANELRVLGVTTIYSMEAPDVVGPMTKMPIRNVSALAENIVLLRFVEQRGRLRRLLAVLKVRDSRFDPSIYEFALDEGRFALGGIAESTVRFDGGDRDSSGTI